MNENLAFRISTIVAFIAVFLFIIGVFFYHNYYSIIIDAYEGEDIGDIADAEDSVKLALWFTQSGLAAGFCAVGFMGIGIFLSVNPALYLSPKKKNLIKTGIMAIFLGAIVIIAGTFLFHIANEEWEDAWESDEIVDALNLRRISYWVSYLGHIFVFLGVGLIGMAKSDLYGKSPQPLPQPQLGFHVQPQLPPPPPPPR